MKTRYKALSATQEGFVGLVREYEPWDWWAHFTFEGEWSVRSASKCFERWMRQFKGARYLYAIERNPSREGHHIHAVVGGVGHLRRTVVWKDWWDKYGRNKIVPYDFSKSMELGCYCAKYMGKRDAWWNIIGCQPLGDLELWSQPRSLSEAHFASGQTELPKRCVAREMSRQTASLGPWEEKAKNAIDTNGIGAYDGDHEDIIALTNQTARKRVHWQDGETGGRAREGNPGGVGDAGGIRNVTAKAGRGKGKFGEGKAA